ncbi:MAG: hypothetical protein RIR39_38, partial [Pseudomonadota bacterium]
MSDSQKKRLLEEFQSYLEHTDLDQTPADVPPDLNSLLGEMAALKTEVKVQSRHFKSTLDTLAETLTVVQADNKGLIAELDLHGAQLQQKRSETLRTVLLDIVEIYDRLTVGSAMLQNYRPVASLFGHSKKQDVDFIESFKEGQTMILRRFEQLLQRHGVYSIACVGKLLDPHTMSAVEIGNDVKIENGVVLEELRTGFLFEEKVLRLAEVKV